MCSLESDQEANPNNQDHRVTAGVHIQAWEPGHAHTHMSAQFLYRRKFKEF